LFDELFVTAGLLSDVEIDLTHRGMPESSEIEIEIDPDSLETEKDIVTGTCGCLFPIYFYSTCLLSVFIAAVISFFNATELLLLLNFTFCIQMSHASFILAPFVNDYIYNTLQL